MNPISGLDTILQLYRDSPERLTLNVGTKGRPKFSKPLRPRNAYQYLKASRRQTMDRYGYFRGAPKRSYRQRQAAGRAARKKIHAAC